MTSPYYAEVKDFIEVGNILNLREVGLLAVVAKTSITHRWKEKVVRPVVREKEVVEHKVDYRDREEKIQLQPGIVYCLKWRGLTAGEEKDPPERLQELGAIQRDGRPLIPIVEEIEDLPAACRQSIWHILDKLIGEERIIDDEIIKLHGEAQEMRDYYQKLNSLVLGITESGKISLEMQERTQKILSRIYEILRRPRDEYKRRAAQRLEHALEAGPVELPAEIAMGSAEFLKRRAKVLTIAMQTVKDGEKRLRHLRKTVRRIVDGYRGLIRLRARWEELLRSGGEIQPSDRLAIAKGAQGIGIFLLERGEIYFNPYYRRVHSPEFRSLRNILKHTEVGDDKFVSNSLKKASAKLKAVAIGEIPTWTELRKRKEALP